MKIGCSTLFKADKVGSVTEAAREIKEAGFDSAQLHYEIVTDYANWNAKYEGIFSDEITQELKNLNFEYTLHVPFSHMSFVHENIALSKQAIDFATNAIEQVASLGGKEFVMHMARKPENMSFEKAIELFAERFNPLAEKLKKKNSYIYIENIEENLGVTPEIIEKTLSLVGDAKFCLDIGHANIHGLLDEFLKLPIGHVHAHDNHGKKDEHNVLGNGNIDLEKVFYTLKKQSFNGTITIEPKSIKEGIRSKNIIEKLWEKL